MKKRGKIRFSPAQTVALGFLAMILIGSILLTLPIATTTNTSLPWIDALFTSASAVCVTGLSLFDCGTTLSLFGQIVLIVLIQAGGLGFMTMTSFVYMLIGKRITLKERMVLQESLNQSELQGVVKSAKTILIMTLVIESIGAIVLSIRFIPDYGVGQGIWCGIFHSISAFCNAGFDILGHSNNLASYFTDPTVNITIMLLIVLGGLGFIVIMEITRKIRHRQNKFSLHAKIVLTVTGALLILGCVIFCCMEWNNPDTFGKEGYTAGEKIMGGMFQSVTTRTAGFSSVDQAGLEPASKLVTVLLMFIGASPAGTGGGIKTTTAAVVFLMLISIIKGREDVTLRNKRMNQQVVLRALGIVIISIIFVALVVLVLSIIEQESPITVEEILFESVSAFGTVGLSLGSTAAFAPASKVILALTMFAGRVGLLTVTLAIAKRFAGNKESLRFPEEKVIVG